MDNVVHDQQDQNDLHDEICHNAALSSLSFSPLSCNARGRSVAGLITLLMENASYEQQDIQTDLMEDYLIVQRVG